MEEQATADAAINLEANRPTTEDALADTETMPNTLPSHPDLQLVRSDHTRALLTFERENRDYFAASIPDRGDAFFANFASHITDMLNRQIAGSDYFYVIMASDGEVVGRINLYGVANGTAELGYRIARKAAGRGFATAAVHQMLSLATTAYGLSRLHARVTRDNPASHTVLQRNGFVPVSDITLNGKPALFYRRELS